MEQKHTFLKISILRLLLLLVLFALPNEVKSQIISYPDNWYEAGLSLAASSTNSVEINYSTKQFQMEDVDINGTMMKKIELPGVFLPNNEGAPDLPGLSKYIAVPQGADVTFQLTASRTEQYSNVLVSPAPRIPLETENGPLLYKKNEALYSTNSLYPENPVIISTPLKIRGVDARIIGITPFQYNPVTKELIVYRDVKVNITFVGGNGQFGENRLRNRWWDPILMSTFLNWEILPKANYNYHSDSRTEDFEYLIISPDDPVFLAWADSIKQFRTEQGIRTGIVTTTEVGGNTTTAIENYINNAYNNWSIPPAAVLFLADYGTSGSTITSPTYIYDYTCISDNKYADVDGDHLPDIATARITAQNESQLQIMIEKFLNYERNPPTSPAFYNNPVTALGWSTERWFQICSETIAGFFENELGKTPKRENALYDGNPPFSIWSTATNTATVVNYFGPNGLGYIPASPAYLNDWGGNASRINADLNSGAFLIQHRDHGGETLWGEPAYSVTNINQLTNQYPTFVFSMNCLTGKFNYSSICFSEAFHRSQYGALGLIAATETSYSFVNDAYTWGFYDYMWPNFMPDYGVAGPIKLLPSFGNIYGKYFLQQSSWPYNTGNKECTYYLFHHHGDAFTTVYSEVPQNLTVSHNPVMITGIPSFDVTADENSLIALTLDSEILGVAEGTGAPVSIEVPVITPGNTVTLTVTKQNYYRYSVPIQVVPAEGPYVVVDTCIVNDASGNNNGMLDYGESPFLTLRANNVGVEDATNVTINISSADEFVTITDSSEFYNSVPAGETITINNGFTIVVDPQIPDLHSIPFSVEATDGANTWQSNFSLRAHAPLFELGNYTVSDPGGNNNGSLDPGETADLLIEIKNNGSSAAVSVIGELSSTDPYVIINTTTQVYGNIASGESVTKTFSVSADENTPAGHYAQFDFNINADPGLTAQASLSLIIGQVPVLVLCFDPNHSSSPAIMTSLDAAGVTYDYSESLPPDLNLYRSIFVCLGIYSSNYQLSGTDGQLLADFLNDGGMIYMEGGDTWAYDPQTAVHTMFNIDGISDGGSDLGTIQGVAGTFTEGMSFSYGGENNWIDHLVNISPAYMIFNNVNPAYGCAVAYNQGTYKTIGASFEFGGLTDGAAESTKQELMAKIVDFFGLNPVPVELTAFKADVDEKGITLNWETSTEINNSAFDIERSADNKSFEKIGSIKGHGTTAEPQQYTFKDAGITSGKGIVYYRLKQINLDGSSEYTEAIQVEYSIIPVEFSLSQNYPNPFNPSTTIKFGIPKEVKVTLKVYDILGAEIATIVNQKLDPGYYQYEWNAKEFASGVYIYRIEAGSFVKVKKMMIMK
ncbi:MAG TPA: C25 family cysteine peptidase [Ignavibacteriaceae bacterium]|nr:C25 family cysteine peptidase [Ignavibacteriaceae bacterium]